MARLEIASDSLSVKSGGVRYSSEEELSLARVTLRGERESERKMEEGFVTEEKDEIFLVQRGSAVD